MTAPGHPQDDRLLELAYGEVEGTEERALRKHVEDCPRCRSVLDGIAEVRSAVRRVPPEPAPERGLESLLAYGDLAAARARAQRRNVRWLGLITFATAALLVFVLLPQRQAPGAASSEVARMQVPPPAKAAPKLPAAPPLRFPTTPPPAPGDQFASASGAPAVEKLSAKPKAKDAERQTEAKRDGELDQLALAKKQAGDQRVPYEAPATADEGRRAEPLADAPAASRPSDAVMQSGPSQEAKKELGQAQAASSGLARAKEPAGPAKVAAASPAPAATPPSAPSAGGRLDTGAASSRTAGKEVEGSGVASLLGSSAGADKSLGALGGAGAGAKGAVVARSANALAENAAGKAGEDRPAQLKRLVEVRRSAAQATGDQRKALLLEQCRLEAKLELRASAVGTCSRLAREFPGTPEAQQAIDLARGFSVQPPPPPAP